MATHHFTANIFAQFVRAQQTNRLSPTLNALFVKSILKGAIVGTNRLEAFSDGVLAIIITIMVLELKVPEGMDWAALRAGLPIALSYVLSFVYVGIYWNNHHHLFQLAKKTSGSVLWANLFLLFWLSLFPVTTAWLGEHPHANAPSMLYGMVLLMAAIGFYILEQRIIAADGSNSALKLALGKNLKGKLSPPGYVLGIVLAYFSPILGQLVYAIMAAMWLIPDRGMEQVAQSHPE